MALRRLQAVDQVLEQGVRKVCVHIADFLEAKHRPPLVDARACNLKFEYESIAIRQPSQAFYCRHAILVQKEYVALLHCELLFSL